MACRYPKLPLIEGFCPECEEEVSTKLFWTDKGNLSQECVHCDAYVGYKRLADLTVSEYNDLKMASFLFKHQCEEAHKAKPNRWTQGDIGRAMKYMNFVEAAIVQIINKEGERVA